VSVDGAHFGTAFPHIFLVEFPDLNTRSEFVPFERNVFGFRVFEERERFFAHQCDSDLEIEESRSESEESSNEKESE
jgi:casein kinase II subunit beta